MVAHNVVRILGYLPGGEVWSVTPKFASPLGMVTEYEDLETWAEAIGTEILSWTSTNRLRGFLSSQAGIEGVRVEYRNSTGELEQAAEYIFPSRFAGSGSPRMPYQCSAVISLRTGRPGRSFRGRLYWPCLTPSLTTATLRIPPDDTVVLAGNMAQFLNFIRTSAPVEHDLAAVVVSQTRNTYTPITQLQVGDIVDIQRRRRDSLQEAIVQEPFPPVAP